MKKEFGAEEHGCLYMAKEVLGHTSLRGANR